MTNHDGRADDAPDENSNGAGSESPDEGAAAQKDADEAATTSDSPAGDIS
ncbi:MULTISPECIES: hypothetical protein [Microbacterium]|nr:MULTISPECIES: hypothetical protein [Microbacterium]MDQ1073893.1 hypothetical protein [Microbacterium sp. SORGH_AS_0969]MDQ1114121.1 hypothetical protein [Microbacterium testaceum]